MFSLMSFEGYRLNPNKSKARNILPYFYEKMGYILATSFSNSIKEECNKISPKEAPLPSKS